MAEILVQIDHGGRKGELDRAYKWITEHHEVVRTRSTDPWKAIVVIEDSPEQVWEALNEDPHLSFEITDEYLVLTIPKPGPISYQIRYRKDARQVSATLYTCALCGKRIVEWEGSTVADDAKQHDRWCPFSV